MSTPTTVANPLERIANDPHWLRQFSVADYHQMIESDILTADDRVELLEGWIVKRLPYKPPRASSLSRTMRRLGRILPDNWSMHVQGPITLSDSEPEPDITLSRGEEEVYDTRHPEPADIGVLIEVGDSSVLDDRRYKGELYAKEKIAEFWLINLVDRKIEVCTKPRGGRYHKKIEYADKETVPLVLDGERVAHIPVSELMAKS